MTSSKSGLPNPDSAKIILLKLEHLAHVQDEIKSGIDKINGRLGRVEQGTVGLDKRLTVREEFCRGQVEPALKQIVENRMQLAVWAAKYGAGGTGIGVGIGIVLTAFGKAQGWF